MKKSISSHRRSLPTRSGTTRSSTKRKSTIPDSTNPNALVTRSGRLVHKKELHNEEDNESNDDEEKSEMDHDDSLSEGKEIGNSLNTNGGIHKMISRSSIVKNGFSPRKFYNLPNIEQKQLRQTRGSNYKQSSLSSQNNNNNNNNNLTEEMLINKLKTVSVNATNKPTVQRQNLKHLRPKAEDLANYGHLDDQNDDDDDEDEDDVHSTKSTDSLPYSMFCDKDGNNVRNTLSKTINRNGKQSSINYRKSSRFFNGSNKVDQYRQTAVHQISNCQSLYGIAFNPFCSETNDVFAVAGDKIITLFECYQNGTIAAVLSYIDEKDYFYCCCFAYDTDPTRWRPSKRLDSGIPSQYLLAGGKRGIIRIIVLDDPIQMYSRRSFLQSHGGSINDLKCDPRRPQLLFSCSSDFTIRLWNIQTRILIAIFGGWHGHLDQVIHCDIHQSLNLFASCGVDNTVMIWNYDTPELKTAIELSHTYHLQKRNLSFPTINVHLPHYETRHPHCHYIDCIQWFGDFLITRSVDKKLKMWRPTNDKLQPNIPLSELCSKIVTRDDCNVNERNPKKNIIEVYDFPVDSEEQFFIKFSLNHDKNNLALGDQYGNVYFADLSSDDLTKIVSSYFEQRTSCLQTTVRNVAYNISGSTIILIQDQGYVTRIEKTNSIIKLK